MESWLFLGDSIGAADNSFADQLIDRLGRVNAVNSSVDSSNIFDILDRVQELLPDEAFANFVIFVGVNDSKIFDHLHKPLVEEALFEEKYGDLLARLEVTPCTIYMCGLPNLMFDHISASGILHDRWTWDPSKYERYSTIIEELAGKQENRHFVNLEGTFLTAPNRDKLFGPDGVHPSSDGHTRIADAIEASIRKSRKGS